MATWKIEHDRTTDQITLTYINADGTQNCGSCEARLKDQLYDWLFSPGQVGLYDVVIMDGQQFVPMKRARA